MIKIRIGDADIDGVYFPNGYHFVMTYGYIKNDGEYRNYGTKFTDPCRYCKLEDPKGILISEFVEKNPERIPKKIFDILYPEDAKYYRVYNEDFESQQCINPQNMRGSNNLRIGDFEEDEINFPNGYQVKFVHGEYDKNSKFVKSGSKLTANLRKEILYNPEGVIISQLIERNWGKLDEEHISRWPI